MTIAVLESETKKPKIIHLSHRGTVENRNSNLKYLIDKPCLPRNIHAPLLCRLRGKAGFVYEILHRFESLINAKLSTIIS